MLSKKIVKYIQSLSLKKFRDAEDAFVAEGPKIVAEFLLQSKMQCVLICAEQKWLVENEALLERLREMGCDEAQGYFIGRPMAVINADEWMVESGWIKQPQ